MYSPGSTTGAIGALQHHAGDQQPTSAVVDVTGEVAGCAAVTGRVEEGGGDVDTNDAVSIGS